MIGIQRLIISKNTCAYFLKRPFGNYLIFADELTDISNKEMQLIDSQGGISKIFLESVENINSFHYKLFDRYGATAVCDIQKPISNKHIKIERLKDHADPSVKFMYHGLRKLVYLKQKDASVLIVGKNIYFEGIDNISFSDKNILDQILKLRAEYKFEIMYFTSFKTDSVLNFKVEPSLIIKFKKFLKRLI